MKKEDKCGIIYIYHFIFIGYEYHSHISYCNSTWIIVKSDNHVWRWNKEKKKHAKKQGEITYIQQLINYLLL